MANFVYNAVDILFGGGLTDAIADWMGNLYATIQTIINGGLVTTVMNVFAAIACSMLILYFFMDLVDQAKRDMFSFEKLIVAFIKFLAAFVVLLCLPELLRGVVNIGRLLYEAMLQDNAGSIRGAINGGTTSVLDLFTDIPAADSGRSNYSVMPEWFTNTGDTYSATVDAFEDAFGFSIGKVLDNIQLLIMCVIVWLVGMIARIAGYFIVTSNAVMIIARVIFSPIAVVQLFEDGTKSSGMRYLKGLAADCITMAVIVIVLAVASAVTNGLVANNLGEAEITCENLASILNFGSVAVCLVPELVAVGGMAAGNKIAHDIMGA